MTHHVPESRRCKRGCCWTPFETCGTTYVCRCHATTTGVHDARLRLEDLLDALGGDE